VVLATERIDTRRDARNGAGNIAARCECPAQAPLHLLRNKLLSGSDANSALYTGFIIPLRLRFTFLGNHPVLNPPRRSALPV